MFKPFGMRFIIVMNMSYACHKCRQGLQLTSKFVLNFFFSFPFVELDKEELKMRITLRNNISVELVLAVCYCAS